MGAFDFNYKDYNYRCDIGMMTPLQYNRMIDLLEEYQPNRICELGSGESTKIFKKYSEMTNATAYSIEHDFNWNKYDSFMFPLIENVQLNVANHIYNKCNIYADLERWLDGQDKFDFILIDAPNDGIPQNYNGLEYARIQTVDFPLLDKMNDKCVVMYHDSDMDIAQNTLNEFERILEKLNYTYQKENVIEKDTDIAEYNRKFLGRYPQLTIYIITKEQQI